MKTIRRQRRGFTLIELSVTVVFGLAISSAGMLLLNQQLKIVEIFNRQNFILKEAPQINHSISSILSKADAIRLHETFSDAVNDTNAVVDDATVLVAAFRNVDESVTFGIISFDQIGGDDRLNYYFYDPAGPAPTEGTPSWTISRSVTASDFSLISGLFQLRLTGPEGEFLTYTIAPN